MQIRGEETGFPTNRKKAEEERDPELGLDRAYLTMVALADDVWGPGGASGVGFFIEVEGGVRLSTPHSHEGRRGTQSN